MVVHLADGIIESFGKNMNTVKKVLLVSRILMWIIQVCYT